jgi:hypothetical protein
VSIAPRSGPLQGVYLYSNGCGDEGYDKAAKVLAVRARVGSKDRRCPAVPTLQERLLECAEEDTTDEENLANGSVRSHCVSVNCPGVRPRKLHVVVSANLFVKSVLAVSTFINRRPSPSTWKSSHLGVSLGLASFNYDGNLHIAPREPSPFGCSGLTKLQRTLLLRVA